MKERPILFNGDMVRAVLSGQKTQTRRVIKGRPIKTQKHALFCPYGHPGDRLWVRETWYYEMHMHDMTAGEPNLPGGLYSHRCIYCADQPDYPVDIGVGGDGWCPPCRMPRWFSRITLEITDVHVERVQDITNDEAIAEGAYEVRKVGDDIAHATWTMDGLDWRYDTPREAFAATWGSLYAADGLGWDVNPWVWVVTFKRMENQKCPKN